MAYGKAVVFWSSLLALLSNCGTRLMLKSARARQRASGSLRTRCLVWPFAARVDIAALLAKNLKTLADALESSPPAL